MNRLTKIIFRTIIFIIISIGYYFLNLKFSFSIHCIFHKLTGFYCPGCGITRMIFAMLRFDFYQAFRFNPFVFLLLIVYSVYLFIYIIVKVKLKKELIIPRYLYYVLLVITIVFGILRNTELFSFLMPTVI